MQPNPELIRLRSLAQRTHDASALASFIERSKPSLAINIFDVLSWICDQVASEHVKMNLSCLFAQSLLRCIEAINAHAGRGRAGFLEIFSNAITNPGNIWICVQDVHKRVVNDINLETSARLLTARTNLTVLNLLATLPTIDITPGTTGILVQMAYLEMMAGSAEITEEHDVIMKLNHYLPAALLSQGPEIAWQKEVFEPMRGDVVCIASVTLWHLEFRRSLPDTSPDWAIRVGYAALLIHTLSHSPIGEALVVQNSHVILVEALTSLSARPQTASPELNFLVHSACKALAMHLHEVDSLERQITAHEAGILPALLRCSKLLRGDIYTTENGWYTLLFRCLLPSIIYPSISRVAKREMHNFKIKSLAPKVDRLYTQLRAVMDDIAAIKPAKPMCENCRERNELEAPKLCTGCKRIYYCSKLCQTSHWKKHRNRCKSYQRSSGMSHASLSPKDYSAVPDMLYRELQMRFSQMISIRRKYAFKEPLNVEINYADFPFQITVGSAHFVPDKYHQLAAQDREMIDKLGGAASRIPGSIIARYFYSAGDLQRRLGEIMIIDQPKLMLSNMEGKLSEKYYSVRARKDDGTYEVVHQL